jgi:hypothetical protein
MEQFRKNQIREILDIDRNISKQVMGRQRKQAQQQDENIVPKRMRDLEIEVSVDKTIESLQGILQQKKDALEELLQTKSSNSKAFLSVIDTSAVTSSWNAVVRLYQTPSITNQTQEMIKVKAQDIKPFIDAMQFGLFELAKSLIEESKVVSMVSSLSVYTSIKEQLEESQFRLLSPTELQSQINSYVSDLPENVRDKLKVGFTKAKIPQGIQLPTSDFKERLKDIETELGVTLDAPQLRDLPRSELTKRFTSGLGLLRKQAKSFPELLKQVQLLKQKQKDINDALRDNYDDKTGFIKNELNNEIYNEMYKETTDKLNQYEAVLKALEEEAFFIPKKETPKDTIKSLEEQLEEKVREDRRDREFFEDEDKYEIERADEIPEGREMSDNQAIESKEEAEDRLLESSRGKNRIISPLARPVERDFDIEEKSVPPGVRDLVAGTDLTAQGFEELKKKEREFKNKPKSLIEYYCKDSYPDALTESGYLKTKYTIPGGVDKAKDKLWDEFFKGQAIEDIKKSGKGRTGKGKVPKKLPKTPRHSDNPIYRSFGQLRPCYNSSASSSSDEEGDPLDYDDDDNDPYRHYQARRR